MTDVEALRLALAKEKEAVERYRSLCAGHRNLRETFSSLMSEEEKHVRMIEEKIARATRG